MTSSSPGGMSIQFKTLTFHSRPEEQLQERLHLNKFTTSLLAVIGALGSPLGPHSERDLATDLYSRSTPISIMDKFDHRISFNCLNKSVISLPTATGASGSPLGPRSERDLAIVLYCGSSSIAIKTSPIIGSILDDFKKVQHHYKR
jgi:hypothetical protein